MEASDYQAWMLISNGISGLITIAVFVVGYMQKKHNKAMLANDKNARDLQDHYNEHSKEIETLKTKVKYLPSYRSMLLLQKNIHAVDTKVSTVQGQLIGIDKKLTMIDNFLMNRK